jgi:hypothetical protein
MGKGRNARLKLSEADRQAADLQGTLADIQADSEGRRARFLEIVAGLEATPPDELRGLVARWQIEAEFLRARIALAEAHAYAQAPLADLGWQTLEGDLKVGETRGVEVGERYADDAEQVATKLFSEPGKGWKDLYRALRADPGFVGRLPDDDAIRKQMTKRGVRPCPPASGTRP